MEDSPFSWSLGDSPAKFADSVGCCSPTREGSCWFRRLTSHTHKSGLQGPNPPRVGTQGVPPVGVLLLTGHQGLCEWIGIHQRQRSLSCWCGWKRVLRMKGLADRTWRWGYSLSTCGVTFSQEVKHLLALQLEWPGLGTLRLTLDSLIACVLQYIETQPLLSPWIFKLSAPAERVLAAVNYPSTGSYWGKDKENPVALIEQNTESESSCLCGVGAH